ncbi:MAG TPA: DHHA1 domain-containing protein, partial [Saprospiraceae bacterium]|nr:DHHA1 domain-containing protein [Saprospiraceae bacterium]
EKEIGNAVIVFGSVANDKPLLTVRISDNLTTEKGLNAGQMVREMSKEIKGGGGGQAFFATAGGSDVSGLEKALAKVRELMG